MHHPECTTTLVRVYSIKEVLHSTGRRRRRRIVLFEDLVCQANPCKSFSFLWYYNNSTSEWKNHNSSSHLHHTTLPPSSSCIDNIHAYLYIVHRCIYIEDELWKQCCCTWIIATCPSNTHISINHHHHHHHSFMSLPKYLTEIAEKAVIGKEDNFEYWIDEHINQKSQTSLVVKINGTCALES